MKKIFNAWLPVLAWMAVIFFFSNQNAAASNMQSDAVAGPFRQFLENLFGDVSYEIVVVIVRKSAHFLEYAVLSALLYRAGSIMNFTHPMLMAVMIAAGYAATDEFHQLFIDGRSSQMSDVILDAFGAFCGAMLYAGLMKRRRGRTEKKAALPQ